MVEREHARGPVAPKTVRTGARTPPAVSPLLRLQTAAGNRATTALVTEERRATAAVQLYGPTDAPPASDERVGLPFMATAKRQASTLRGNAAEHVANLALYNAQANLAFGAFEPKRTQAAERYSRAFETHTRVLSAARQASMNQDVIESVVIGAAVSFAVAGAAAALLPASVLGAAFVSTAGLLNAGGQAVLGAAGGTALAGTIATNADAFNAVGSADSDRVAGYRRMHELQSQARRVATLGPRLGMLLGNCEYALGQINLHEAGGQTDLAWTETLELLTDLKDADDALQLLDAELVSAREQLASLQQASASWRVPSTSELEGSIWVVWIAQVSDPDVLDRDEIENHLHRIGVLGSSSLLGVDFGGWTSAEDEQAAIAAARTRRAQLESAANPSGAP